jgi:uncharacterized protein (DUF3084 family)
MSTFGVVALIILPILGGLIAWAGDVIGYRLGKSRRSLFGLRPRTTARMLGVAVGVLLPLLTFGFALAGSRYARQAVFELDRLQQQQQQLVRENEQLDRQIQEADAATEAARREALTLAGEVNVKRKELLVAQTSVLRAERQLGAAHRNFGRLQGEVGRLRSTVKSLRDTKQRLAQQAEKLRVQYQGMRASFQQVRHDLRETEGELVNKTAEVNARMAELKAAQSEYQRLENRYLYQRNVVTGPVLFEAGHELVRAIVDARQPLMDLDATLTKLLLPASEAAATQGAVVGANGLAIKAVMPLPASWKPGDELPSEDDIISHVATELHESEMDRAVVGIRVLRRVFRAEDLPPRVEYWVAPYKKVFSEGDVVYSAVLSGDDVRAEHFNQLWNLLTKLVRREAQERGLLPHPRTGEYGQFQPAQILEALDEIGRQKGPARVSVVAARDTYTTDPLQVRIEVTRDERSARAPGPRR